MVDNIEQENPAIEANVDDELTSNMKMMALICRLSLMIIDYE